MTMDWRYSSISVWCGVLWFGYSFFWLEIYSILCLGMHICVLAARELIAYVIALNISATVWKQWWIIFMCCWCCFHRRCFSDQDRSRQMCCKCVLADDEADAEMRSSFSLVAFQLAKHKQTNKKYTQFLNAAKYLLHFLMVSKWITCVVQIVDCRRIT